MGQTSPDQTANSLHVVAMGTSLTAKGGWVEPLATALTQGGQRQVRVEVVALSGASSRWGKTAVEAVARKTPDVVLIEFATNDAAVNRLLPPWTSRDNLRSMLACLAAARRRPRVIVMAMNPVAGLPRLMRPLLAYYNGVHARVAEEAGADFIDFRPAWRDLSPDAFMHALPDGLHPRADQAVSIMVPDLVKAIANAAADDRLDQEILLRGQRAVSSMNSRPLP